MVWIDDKYSTLNVNSNQALEFMNDKNDEYDVKTNIKFPSK